MSVVRVRSICPRAVLRRAALAGALVAAAHGLGACARAPTPSARHVTAPPAPPPRPTEPPAPAVTDDREPVGEEEAFAAVSSPTGPTLCAWTSISWRPKRDLELRVSPGGPRYARTLTLRASARVTVSESSSGMATFVEIDTEQVRIRGYISPSALPLHPNGPIAIAGVFAPEGRADLALVGAATGQAEVQLAIPERVVPRKGLSTRGFVACEKVGLDPGRVDTLKAFVGEYQRGVRLPNQAAHQLYDAPSGKPLLRVLRSDEDTQVRSDLDGAEIERVGGWSRVALGVGDLTVAGWTPSSTLTSLYSGGVGGFGIGRAHLHPARRPTLRTVACAPEIPLLARTKEKGTPRYVRVGQIKTGVPIELVTEGEQISEVQLKDTNTDAVESFAVPAGAVARCREVVPDPRGGPSGRQ